MTCPDGSAISGWYNLPNIPVKGGQYGGPANATGLRLFCRSTPVLSSCQQPTASYCQGGGIVNSLSFDSNQFKLGCCKTQRLEHSITYNDGHIHLTPLFMQHIDGNKFGLPLVAFGAWMYPIYPIYPISKNLVIHRSIYPYIHLSMLRKPAEGLG